MMFWLVLKLEISYRVMMSWRILVSFRGFFWRLYICMVKYLNFHNSSFCLKILFTLIGKATVWHTPCFKSRLCFYMHPYVVFGINLLTQWLLTCFIVPMVNMYPNIHWYCTNPNCWGKSSGLIQEHKKAHVKFVFNIHVGKRFFFKKKILKNKKYICIYMLWSYTNLWNILY